MRRPRGILDTSPVIALGRVVDPSSLPHEPLIAATAIANGLPIYTCNAADFAGIDGVEVVPVAPVPAS